MKTKKFTKSILVVAFFLLAIGSANAQSVSKKDSLLALQKNAISLIAPGQGISRGDSRIGLWGYAFGDYAYMGKGDSAGRGTKQQYKGVGAAGQNQNPNAFEVRRAYLGADFKINKTFTAYALLAYEGDQDVNADRTVYLKYIYVKWKNIWKGTDLKIGQQATNSFASGYNTEPLLGYRSVEKTLMDMHGMDGSSDMGLTLEGKIWTAHAMDTANVPLFIGYSAMVGDNSGNTPVAGFTGTIANSNLGGATVTSTSTSTSTTTGATGLTTTTTTTTKTAIAVNPLNTTTDVAKKFRGNLYVNLLNTALTIGVYGDYINYGDFYGTSTTKSYQHAVSTQKVYAAYNSKWFGIGGELDMQSYTNGEFESITSNGKTTKDTVTANQMGFSIFAHGTIIQKRLNIFARYDMYTPDTKYKNTAGDTYTDIATNVASGANANSYKETFINAGLDWTPTKDRKMHIMPNIWYYGIKNGIGSDNLGSDNYLLYRLSFLFAFN